MNISYEKMNNEFVRILIRNGFIEKNAIKCSKIFVDNTFDGVFSHGVNRFPFFIKMVKSGEIQPNMRPKRKMKIMNIEQWDGKLGPGPLNAQFCLNRAIKIAKKKGVSCVALKNTNHWMRAGAYGWQAAQKGMLAICFTNTKANMPPWGGKECRIGNNPLVLAVPFNDKAVVLDMAMSQYSFGKLGIYLKEKKELPYAGGYNVDGELTSDPLELKESQRVLPIGLWKGSGLSILLDLFAALLSNGRSVLDVFQFGEESREIGVSQVFICFSLKFFGKKKKQNRIIKDTIEFIKSSAKAENIDDIYYPGEKSYLNRQKNLKDGVDIPDYVWEKVLSLT